MTTLTLDDSKTHDHDDDVTPYVFDRATLREIECAFTRCLTAAILWGVEVPSKVADACLRIVRLRMSAVRLCSRIPDLLADLCQIYSFRSCGITPPSWLPSRTYSEAWQRFIHSW